MIQELELTVEQGGATRIVFISLTSKNYEDTHKNMEKKALASFSLVAMLYI